MPCTRWVWSTAKWKWWAKATLDEQLPSPQSRDSLRGSLCTRSARDKPPVQSIDLVEKPSLDPVPAQLHHWRRRIVYMSVPIMVPFGGTLPDWCYVDRLHSDDDRGKIFLVHQRVATSAASGESRHEAVSQDRTKRLATLSRRAADKEAGRHGQMDERCRHAKE